MGNVVYCCEVCDDLTPEWRVVRIGDVAVTWACSAHLAAACERLQRDFEVTRLEVTCRYLSKPGKEVSNT